MTRHAHGKKGGGQTRCKMLGALHQWESEVPTVGNSAPSSSYVGNKRWSIEVSLGNSSDRVGSQEVDAAAPMRGPAWDAPGKKAAITAAPGRGPHLNPGESVRAQEGAQTTGPGGAAG